MTNPVRNCVGCGQTDDHPRHVVDVGGGQELAWHMDCHSRVTPPCGVCTHQLLDVAVGTTGQALRDHLIAMPPKQVHPDGSIDVHHSDGRVEHFGADGYPLAPAVAAAPVVEPATTVAAITPTVAPAPVAIDPTGGN